MTECHWTQVLSALLMPTIVVFGTWIAYRQWRTSQDKLKHDLFERRFAIYVAAKNLIGDNMSTDKVDEQMTSIECLTKFLEAKWLLNEDIYIYLVEEIWKKSIRLKLLEVGFDKLIPDEEKSENIHKQTELREWYANQFKVLDKKFTPFLKLKH